jgi:hypothetical protein
MARGYDNILHIHLIVQMILSVYIYAGYRQYVELLTELQNLKISLFFN